MDYSLREQSAQRRARHHTDDNLVVCNACGIQNEFEEHPDIIKTRGWDPEFLAHWREGFLSYKKGDWETAREIFTLCKVHKSLYRL